MPHSSPLFAPLKLRDVTFRNRIGVSPMCMYSSEGGFANDWHLVHLGSRAVGGAGLVIAEATAVTPEGRISPADLGIWRDEHVEELRHITGFIGEHGAVPAIQLAHAGRKASTAPPWQGRRNLGEDEGGWRPIVAPSPLPFDPSGDDAIVPQALDEQGIARLIAAFREGARRSLEAGFQVVEIHAAHGYLLHSFLSPLSNRRDDRWGGDFEGRTRLLREVVEEVRQVWPERLPLFVRISATDWADGGWDLEQSTELARRLGALGVDLIDCSSGALLPDVEMPVGPGYQCAFAEAIRRDAALPTAAVGLITDPSQADAILRADQADLILLGRELLRDPYWPLHAADALGEEVEWPAQYLRGKE